MGEEDMVLIAGGKTGEGITSGVDFYDPTTNSFTSPDLTMNHSRFGHTATALLDGTVLIVGGDPDSSTAEIFDPATPKFTDTSVMAYPRSNHRATLLQNGTVLITGSDETDKLEAEIYDPKTGAFTKTGPMHAARCSHTSTLLPNGEVLITGGQDNGNDGPALSSAELYDPDTGEFTVIGETMAGGARFNHQATLLDNGAVLITGGNNGVSQLTSAEIYSPPDSGYSTGHFSLIDEVMLYAHEGHQAVLLRDGTVLLIGGNISSVANEIFNPDVSTFRATGPMSRDRSYGATAVLTDGRVLITGGMSTGTATNTAEVWNALVPFPTHVISGTITYYEAGVGGVMLVGLPGHPMTNNGGYYEGLVMYGWSGTVTPTKPGYTFDPPNRNYYEVVVPISGEDYSVTSAPAFQLAFNQQDRKSVV
jgi:WD40 repeat protein